MDVTVAICTWNRAALLAQTLERLCLLFIPHDVEWELLIVNNNCTDDTDAVISQCIDRLPIRRLFEPRPGLSNARNCASAAARGELIVWTDDDVLVDEQWLAQYVVTARKNPNTSFFGGPIQPWFEVPPPNWMAAAISQLGGVFGRLDLGSESFQFDDSNPFMRPFGANYAVRTRVQRKHLYNPELGRKEGERLAGEETDLFTQLTSDGHRGRWIPDARIRHFIPQEKMTTEYVRDYCYGYGRTIAMMDTRSTTNLRSTLWAQAVQSEIICRFHQITTIRRSG